MAAMLAFRRPYNVSRLRGVYPSHSHQGQGWVSRSSSLFTHHSASRVGSSHLSPLQCLSFGSSLLVVDGTNILCRCRGDVDVLARHLATLKEELDDPHASKAVCVFDPPLVDYDAPVRTQIDASYKAHRDRSQKLLGDDGGSFLTEGDHVAIPGKLGPRVSPKRRRPSTIKRRRMQKRLDAVSDVGFRPVVAKRGYEADDAVASIVAMGADADIHNIAVASADADMASLLSANVVWLRLKFGAGTSMKSSCVTYDDWLREHGFSPSLYADWVALGGKRGSAARRGGAGDIRGADGVTPKVAAELVARFGGVEACLLAAEQHVADTSQQENVTPPKWMRALAAVHANRDQVRTAFQLAMLRSDAMESIATEEANMLRAWLCEM